MIKKFDSNGTSIIIVSHDDNLIKKIKHDEILMKEGVISK
jgi:ABC-type ATPase involved in cell division